LDHAARPVTVDALNVRFGRKHILKDVSLKIEPGRLYAIVGPNGSGKTTLLNSILKTVDSSGGSVYLYGNDNKRMGAKAIARMVSAVPQSTAIEFDFTVEEVVMMGRMPYLSRFRTESPDDFEIVDQSLRLADVEWLRERLINRLSGGERQRAVIARAICQTTGLILMDEPVSSLDIHHQISVLNTVRGLVQNSGVTVMLVLHDLNLAMQYSDEVVLMDDGRIVKTGAPEEVLTPGNIGGVYGIEVAVVDNPLSRRPYILARFNSQ